MATLTDISIGARKTIRYSIYALILIVVVRFSFTAIIAIYQKLFPPPPPAPTVAFGKLQSIPFPSKSKPDGLTFQLQTPDGNLPGFPDQLPVYVVTSPASNLNALDTAKGIAGALGFNPNGHPVVEQVKNVYVFEKTGQPYVNLTINIITGVWSISHDIRSDPSILGQLPPSKEQAVQTAQSFLNLPGQSNADMTGEPITQYLKVVNGELVPAVSLSEANITKVSLYRKSFGAKGEYRSVTADFPKQSNVWFFLAGGSRNVVAAEYHYFPVDEKRFATYPLISAQDAWNQLTSGNAYIAGIAKDAPKEIPIRRVYLAYYDPGQYSPYFQPVVVFEGDYDFSAFVPAVKADYYGVPAQ